jgi:hypothetical protein
MEMCSQMHGTETVMPFPQIGFLAKPSRVVRKR